MAQDTVSPLTLIAGVLTFVAAMKVFVFDVIIVSGHSMEPTLVPGQLVLVNKTAFGLRAPFSGDYLIRWAEPKAGDILVIESPLDGTRMVKRLAALIDQALYVVGDNLGDSVDSREYGLVPLRALRGEAIPLSMHRRPVTRKAHDDERP